MLIIFFLTQRLAAEKMAAYQICKYEIFKKTLMSEKLAQLPTLSFVLGAILSFFLHFGEEYAILVGNVFVNKNML